MEGLRARECRFQPEHLGVQGRCRENGGDFTVVRKRSGLGNKGRFRPRGGRFRFGCSRFRGQCIVSPRLRAGDRQECRDQEEKPFHLDVTVKP